MKNAIVTFATIAALNFVSTMAMAQETATDAPEITATPVAVTIPAPKVVKNPLTDEEIAAFTAKTLPICQKAAANGLILTKQATAACQGETKYMVKLTKRGDAFQKGKTGAEFNALLANFDNFK